MNNNDILRRLRYTFELNDKSMINTFAEGGLSTDREHISDWLKRDDDPAYEECPDVMLAAFLNGLINLKRGKREGEQPAPEERLTNNNIFMKLKIALNLQAEDILEMMNRSAFRLSKHELSAFFRKADHKHFRKCQDQVLRNFLKGLQLTHRPGTEDVDGDSENVVATDPEAEAAQPSSTTPASQYSKPAVAETNAPEPEPAASSPWSSAGRKTTPAAKETPAAKKAPAAKKEPAAKKAAAQTAPAEIAEPAIPDTATDTTPSPDAPAVESVWGRKKT
ncbi:MAG: hypothetical protein ACI96P_001704 [Candidatus Azotimanducaceae bacterium]|jgi:uncharacterized protein YehS (DUF1456 family)